MDDLTKLAIKYGTDKWGKHHYTPVYYELFKDRRNDIESLIEIGPAEGAGLFMFRDFFPNAKIFGLEIDVERVKRLSDEERIDVYLFDQSKDEDYQWLFSDIYIDAACAQIIIDDGSHKTEDQLKSALKLVGDRTYIIEDVADDTLKSRIEEGLIRQDRQLSYTIKEIRLSNRYDDRLIIIEPK